MWRLTTLRCESLRGNGGTVRTRTSVTRAVLTGIAVVALLASPARGQSAGRGAQQSCSTLLSGVLDTAVFDMQARAKGKLADSIWDVFDALAPKSLQELKPAEIVDRARYSLEDTLATRLEAFIRGQPDTLAARNEVATVFADILRGSREPLWVPTPVVELVYAMMKLPSGPAEEVAGDITLSVERRAAALNALENVSVDSALVHVLFLNLCQVGTWAGAMPLSDTGSVPAAVTEWGETVLRNVLAWLVVDTEAIRTLAPCKSFERCFPDSPRFLAWLRRDYSDLHY